MRLNASVILCVAGLACVASSWGFELGLGAGLGADTETPRHLYPFASFSVSHKAEGFEAFWDIDALGDGVYGGFMSGAFGYGGVSLLIREGGLRWSAPNLSIEAGRVALKDEFDSPYSLFISGKGNSALSGKIRYEDERFFFSDTWIDLNHNNGTPESSGWEWPDRAAVVKSYGLKFGNFRFGFQDSVVYTNKTYLGTAGSSRTLGPLFDAEYFLNPAPGFFIQYLASQEEGPWQRDVDKAEAAKRDDSSILGFFAEWKDDSLRLRGQLLVDDINMNRFLSPSSYQNPDKIAWTFGGSLKTEQGEFSLDHAGAFAYTFQSYGDQTSNNMVSYTFYPDVRYTVSDALRTLEPEDVYLGYLHGENNVALRGSWKQGFGDLRADAALEFTLSGSKSPTNPWGNYSQWRDGGQGTHFLEDSVLEKKLVLSGGASYKLGDFTLLARVSAGGVWNRLKANSGSADPVNGSPIYSPSSESAFIGSLTLGGKWVLKY